MKSDGTCGKNVANDNAAIENCQFHELVNDAYRCKACNPTFFSDGNGCTACAADCLYCKNASSCAMCRPGTFWDAANTRCSRCAMQGCRQCKAADKCTVCAKGTYVHSDGTCKKCDRSCKDCVGPKRSDCLSCHEGVLITKQKDPKVEYESQEKIDEMMDNPPTEGQMLDYNFEMQQAVRTAPTTRRILQK